MKKRYSHLLSVYFCFFALAQGYELLATEAITPDQPLAKKERRFRVNRFLSTNSKSVGRISIRTMNVEQLKEGVVRELARNYKEGALKYIEQLLKIAESPDDVCHCMLLAANLYYDLEKYSQASLLYTKFCLLYQGSSQIELASYRAIQCAQKMIRAIDQDQTATVETLELAQQFLIREIFTTYRPQVEAIYAECCSRIVDYEFYICEFNFSRKNIKGTEQRLAYIRKEWLPRHPGAQERIDLFEQRLAALRPAHTIIVAPTTEEAPTVS